MTQQSRFERKTEKHMSDILHNETIWNLRSIHHKIEVRCIYKRITEWSPLTDQVGKERTRVGQLPLRRTLLLAPQLRPR